MFQKFVAVALSMTMLMSLFALPGFAAQEDGFRVVDMDKRNVVTASGAGASTKEARETKYCAEWDMDAVKDLVFSDIEPDFSAYSEISFSVKLDSTGPATILLALHSENDATDGIDYYSKPMDIEPGEWTDLTFRLADLAVNREPLGFDQIHNITLHGTGWTNTHEPGAVMYVEGFTLSGEPMGDLPAPTASASPRPTGDMTFTEDDTEVGTSLFFNGKASGLTGLTNQKKTNIIEMRKDSDGQDYMYFETLDANSDFHLDLTIAHPTRYMAVHMLMAADGNCLNGNIQYKDGYSTSTTVMKLSGATLTIGSQELTTLNTNGEYKAIDLIFDFAKNTVNAYVDGELTLTDVSYTSDYRDSISMLRIYCNNGNTVGSNLMIKDYQVYEGAEPREIAADEKPPRIPKIPIDNSKAIRLLGDVVALGIGGNGIYYNEEKHPIDAPAFIEGDRTLVPMRAIAEAFGLEVGWDEDTGTASIDGKAQIVIGETEMTLMDGSTYTLDVPAATYNDRTFLPLRALCEQVLGKQVYWDDHGLIVVSDTPYSLTNEADIQEVVNYLIYDRPMADELIELFNSYNKNVHPRVMMDPARYQQVKENYANDEIVKKWGDQVINSADSMLNKAMPEYVIPDGLRLLDTSRDVYGRAKTLSMAYILTEDKKYADNLYQVFQAAGSFPDWNPKHFLDVGEMTCAFAIGYDWLYDVWTDEQRAFLEDCIYKYGLTLADQAYYSQISVGGIAQNNTTNWNVVCNGGIAMGAIAIFDKDPEFCANILQLGMRDVETMMNSFYPGGAWFEGIGYWSYTLDYTINMFSSLEACFGTDFNLAMAPGFENTIYFSMAGDGPTGINNYHDVGTEAGHQNTPDYFWLSNRFNNPGVTNVRLFNMEENGWAGTPFDILWYDTSIKGTDFELPLDTYLPEVEFVSMRNSWIDTDGAWLSFHAGAANVNHSHLDTGSFVVDMLGERWACDLGSDNYNLPDYFGSGKHNIYRIRTESHNLYVINPDAYPGQDINSFSKVETFVTKPRGSYAIADLTPAYSRDVTSARRGYMLGDDRRSAIIRDEITFKQDDNDFYWFTNCRPKTNIEIVDKHTAILELNGKKVKLLVDSNIPDYELSVMDAKPLPGSPVVEGQNENAGFQKIAITGKASGSIYVQVKFIPYEDPNANNAFENIALDDWTIADGEFQPLPVAPRLTGIEKDGVPVAGFKPNMSSYTVSVAYGSEQVPQITAVAEEGAVAEVLQSESLDTPTVINVYRTENPDVVRQYTIDYNVLPNLDDPDGYNGYRRLQVADHAASDEPEPEHPASNVSNNDTDAESRWAAEGTQWVQIDLGSEQDVSAVGLSWWKGNGRVYSFEVQVSSDGQSFETVVPKGFSSGETDSIEYYDFGKTVRARYVRYIGYGNSDNNWNSVTEFAALIK